MKKNNFLPYKVCLYSTTLLVLGVATINTATAGCGVGTTAASSPGQQASLAAMNNLCARTGAAFACAAAPSVGTNTVPLQQLSPQGAIQSESIAITSPYRFIRSINKWLEDHRDNGKNSSGKPNDSIDVEKHKSGGASSSDAYAYIGPIGVSFSGGGGFGDRECTDGQTGYNIDTQQANLILDYQFTQELVGGFAFNYLKTERRLGFNSGNLDSDSYRFAPFLSYTPTPNSYITLLGGYALVNFDSARSVNTGGNLLTDATSNYDANEFFASLGGGYTHHFEDGWKLRGYGRADYNHLSIGGVEENGGVANDGFAYTTKVNGQSILSATTTLGAELTYAYSTNNAFVPVIIPRLHAEWVHEFKNGNRQVQTTYRALRLSDGQPFDSVQSVAVSGPERNWANLGVGLQFEFGYGMVGFLNYDNLFIENGSNQTVTGGFRVNY